MYHGGNRGPDLVTFWTRDASAHAVTEIPPHDGVWEFAVASFAIPTHRTTYACQTFHFHTSLQRHIVAIEPVRMGRHAHHVIVHVCQNNN